MTFSFLVWSAFHGALRRDPELRTIVLARLEVSLGEAGYTPSAQSLIADSYPSDQRPVAMSTFGLGIPLGMLFGVVS